MRVLRSGRRRAAGIAAALLTAAGVLAAPPAAHAVPAPFELAPLVASGPNYQSNLQAVANYWNTARIAIGALNDDKGTAAGQGADSVAPSAGWDDLSRPWNAGQGLVSRTTGKLLMRLYNADSGEFLQLAACSGSVVQSANQSIVLTGAHCIRTNWGVNWIPGMNAIARDVVFIPGFNGAALQRYVMGSDHSQAPLPGTDVAPYGVWPVTRVWFTGSWAQQANHFNDNDFAALLVDNPSDARPIQEVTGGQQVSFTRPRGQSVRVFGYPTDNTRSWYSPNIVNGVPTFTGQPNSHGVAGPLQRTYDGRGLFVSQGQTQASTAGNDDVLATAHSPGSSGGPWFEDFDAATGAGTLVGVTSHYVYNSTGGLDWTMILNGQTGPYMAGTHLGADEQAVFDLAQSQ